MDLPSALIVVLERTRGAFTTAPVSPCFMAVVAIGASLQEACFVAFLSFVLDSRVCVYACVYLVGWHGLGYHATSCPWSLSLRGGSWFFACTRSVIILSCASFFHELVSDASCDMRLRRERRRWPPPVWVYPPRACAWASVPRIWTPLSSLRWLAVSRMRATVIESLHADQE